MLLLDACNRIDRSLSRPAPAKPVPLQFIPAMHPNQILTEQAGKTHLHLSSDVIRLLQRSPSENQFDATAATERNASSFIL